ncbi:MAG TPA: ferritin-like domain-containing protein [Solirubrobacteraceae bacterium]|jgi:rubrerythrin
MTTRIPTDAPALHAVEVGGMTRSSFILRGALAAGALFGASAATPLVSRALAQAGDIEVLNFALTLEYLEADFYTAARELPLREELAALAAEFGEHERQHVDALTATITGLEGEPAKRPPFEFALQSEADFLRLAVMLEDTGVAAYNGAAPRLESKAVLAAAGGIVQVEARHAGEIRRLAGKDPAPAAFDRALSTQEVQAAIEPLIRTS